MARELKRHIKVKGKPVCGTTEKDRKLKFARVKGDATCQRCALTVEK